MEYLIGFFGVGVIGAIICKKIIPNFGPLELSSIILASTIIGGGVYAAGYLGEVGATEILNGEVKHKERETVSCEHSYSCNCRDSTVDGKKVTVCDTCHEHTFDYNWILRTNVGKISIDRVNRQGNIEPPRFTKAKIGDPVAQPHFYINYVRGAKNSLFNPESEKASFNKYNGNFPKYPSRIYDYHYIDRVLFQGDSNMSSIAKDWNHLLALELRELGPNKQANIIFVITDAKEPDYIYGLNHVWKGMNKNDIVVIIGANQNQIQWTSVISWTKDELFNVSLKDAIYDVGDITNYKEIVNITKNKTNELFVRKKMSEYSYLDAQVDIPVWIILIAFLFSALAPLGVSKAFLSHKRYS